jgi:Zn-dependent peptidase ImmA (M78 family)
VSAKREGVTARARAPSIRAVRQPYPEAVAAARAFMAPLGIRDPRDLDLEMFASRKGAIVIPGVTRGDGHVLRGARHALIVVREDLYGTPAGLFVGFHEVGHLLCHHALDELPVCTGERVGGTPGTRRIEGEASDAGAELAMPETIFRPLVIDEEGSAPTLDAIEHAAACFGVEPEAAALRALPWIRTPCALVVAIEGRVAWWACSEGWSVYIHRKAPIPARTAAARVATHLADRLAGGAWGEELRGAVVVTEQARARLERGARKVVAWLTHARI